MATLAIGRNSSRCLSCMRGAGLGSDRHDTIIEYGPDTGKPGCQERWTSVRLDYLYYRMSTPEESREQLRSVAWCSDYIKALPIVEG